MNSPIPEVETAGRVQFSSHFHTHSWMFEVSFNTQSRWHVCTGSSAAFDWEKYLAPRVGIPLFFCIQTTDS